MDANIPISEHMTDRAAAQTVTLRKLLNIRIADSAGKIEKAMDGVKHVDMERVYLRK